LSRAAAVLLAAAALCACGKETPLPEAPPWPDRWGTARGDEPVDAAEKRARRERLAKLAGPDAAVLVLSADESPGFTGATQNLDFTYFSPFDARGAAVVLMLRSDAPTVSDPSDVDDLLYLPQKNPASELWTGAVAGPGDATAKAARVDAARPVERLAADLAEAMKSRRTLFVSGGGPADADRLVKPLVAALRRKFAGTWIRNVDAPGAGEEDAAEAIRLALAGAAPSAADPKDRVKTLPAIEVRSAWRLTTELRETKSPAEIARIRAACAATVLGMKDALRAAKPGMLEMQVAAIVELRCRLAGCERQAYPSIVGAGPDSCVLHYAANTRRMADGDVVVMDIGGQYEGYASDVTRTFPAGGRFSDEAARVYDAVLAAQAAGIARVRPGATLREVHVAAAAVLRDRGLLQWFPHGTSHSVGLDVHDPWRPDAPLRAGAVITVEPGVYVKEKALGVRIEDTVLVTADGCEVLSAGVPKTREAIEKLMAEPPPIPVGTK
jgi:Xaa-Pro aminopeptidase